MPDEDPSAVSEALPAALYVVPDRVESRPCVRKKLKERGPAALTTTELLVVILGSDAKRAGQQIVRRSGLSRLANLTFQAIGAAPGISPAGACRLSAALELHRRLVREASADRPRLSRPADVFREVRDIHRVRREHLVGLYLDAQNFLIHRETVSIGSLNTTRTHPREILYPAIRHLALGFILAHNHPSGCLDPSPEDLEFTAAVKRAGDLVGIELYDHLVVAGDGFTSLRERGLL
jgi:DNA repair protein RadC